MIRQPEFVPAFMCNNNGFESNHHRSPNIRRPPPPPGMVEVGHQHSTVPLYAVNGHGMFAPHQFPHGMQNNRGLLMMQVQGPGQRPAKAFGRPFSPPHPSELIPPVVPQGPAFDNTIETEFDEAKPSPGFTPVNFALCKERFNGIGDVRPFINAVIDFKNCSEMKNESALRSFPLLLTDQAANWWQDNKTWVTDWDNAIKLLRNTYRVRTEQHRIYRRLFSATQNEEPTAVFVQKSKGLLSKIPVNTFTKETQLDLVYAMLHRRIKEKVEREDCDSFTDLLERARQVEEAIAESSPHAPAPPQVPAPPQLPAPLQVHAPPKVPAPPQASAPPQVPAPPEVPAPPQVLALPQAPLEPQSREEPQSPEEPQTHKEPQVSASSLEYTRPQVPASPQSASPVEPGAPEWPATSSSSSLPPLLHTSDNSETPCDHCKLYGQLFERTCRKLHRGEKTGKNIKLLEELSKLDAEKFSKMVCFRCRSDNIVGLQCQKCTHAVSNSCPMINVNIYDMDFNIVVDTGSSHSIASKDLIQHFIAYGQDFSFKVMIMPIRGVPTRQVFRVATVEVMAAGVMIPTMFIELPGSNTTVFGMDFIQKAGLVLDFRGIGCWNVRGAPGPDQPLICEQLSRLQ